MAEIKTKINIKHIGKGQKMVPREIVWKESQRASVRTQHLNMVREHSRPMGLSCSVLINVGL